MSNIPKDLMTIRTEYPYQTLRIWTSGEDPVMHLWIAYTPLDAEQRTNRTFGLLSVRRPKRLPGLLNLAWPALVWFTERIFAEDRHIVEMEQAAHDRQGADWNQEVFSANSRLACLARRQRTADRPRRALRETSRRGYRRTSLRSSAPMVSATRARVAASTRSTQRAVERAGVSAARAHDP